MTRKKELLAAASEIPKKIDASALDVPTIVALMDHLAQDVEVTYPLSAYFLELAKEAIVDPHNPDFRDSLSKFPDVTLR